MEGLRKGQRGVLVFAQWELLFVQRGAMRRIGLVAGLLAAEKQVAKFKSERDLL